MAVSSRFKFLENPVAYRAMQVMWQSFFDEVLQPYHLSHRPYLKADYREGEPFSNGNPIFTALVDSLNRGVRIIQDNQVEDATRYISGWLDDIELDEEKPPIDELVIPLIFSEETKAIAQEFIHAWLVEQVSKEKMEQLLSEKSILAAE